MVEALNVLRLQINFMERDKLVLHSVWCWEVMLFFPFFSLFVVTESGRSLFSLSMKGRCSIFLLLFITGLVYCGTEDLCLNLSGPDSSGRVWA